MPSSLHFVDSFYSQLVAVQSAVCILSLSLLHFYRSSLLVSRLSVFSALSVFTSAFLASGECNCKPFFIVAKAESKKENGASKRENEGAKRQTGRQETEWREGMHCEAID